MTAFRVGQRVVCIRDNPIGGSGFETWPVKGDAYTVREIIVCPWTGETKVRLKEIVNPVLKYGMNSIVQQWECAFQPDRFRPIVSRPTSIAVFQAMLTGKKAGVEA